MATVLQQSLFRDKHSGIINSGQIATILHDIIHRMLHVQVTLPGHPVRHTCYLDCGDRDFPVSLLKIVGGGWEAFSSCWKNGSCLTVSFDHFGRSFFFETQVLEVEEKTLSIVLPRALLYYPKRRVPRAKFPAQIPVAAEFLDPWTRRETLVREVEDMGYDGLSFRTCSKDLPLVRGTVISRMDLCTYENSCYSTAVKVAHATPYRDVNGEEYHKVGVTFQEQAESDSRRAPLLKENECEEIAEPARIKRILKKLVNHRTPVQIQETTHDGNSIRAVPETMQTEENPLLLYRVLPRIPFRVRFSMGQPVRILCFLNGDLYLFLTSASGSSRDKFAVKIPDRIYKVQRRRSLRSFRHHGNGIRIVFQTPLLDTRVARPVLDLSEKGLSITVDVQRFLLFAGMRVDDAQLVLNGKQYSLPRLKIQRVKTVTSKRGRKESRVGILFDHLSGHTREAILASLMEEHHPALVRSTHCSIQEIWDLYHRSGFIYPEKHSSIMEMQDEINRTWEKLYAPETGFFFNLSFVQKEKFLGTGSILQVYDKTWLLQHLSALKNPVVTASREVNLGLAEELMRDKNIHYIKTYFRPNNPWPNKNFRAFALQQLHPLDYDLTHYRLYQRNLHPIPNQELFSPGVEVRRMTRGDREIIKNYFVRKGKVLFARSESLFGNAEDLGETSKRYRTRGLRRQRRIFVAGNGPEVLCFAVAEDASFGVNLSGLLNHCRLFVVNDRNPAAKKVLPFLLNHVFSFYRSLGYSKVSLMTIMEQAPLMNPWEFSHVRDYYCLTFQRKSILKYLHYIREKYGKLERRILKQVK